MSKFNYNALSILDSAIFISRYTAGVDMVTYKADTSGLDTRSLSGSSVDTSGPVDWSGATTENHNNRYALNIRLVRRRLASIFIFILLYLY